MSLIVRYNLLIIDTFWIGEQGNFHRFYNRQAGELAHIRNSELL